MNDLILVYIACPTKKSANEIAESLLQKRLIACANIFPVNSLYWWKAKIAKEDEVVLIGKAENKKYTQLEKEVEKIHPYSVPCIAKIPVSFNRIYSDWLMKELKK